MKPFTKTSARLRPVWLLLCAAAGTGGSAALAQASAGAQPAAAPAAVPAGADAPLPAPRGAARVAPEPVSPKNLRDAEEAYVRGARALDHKERTAALDTDLDAELAAAEREFTRATELNPRNRDYSIALAVTREHRLTGLVQRAAAAQRRGNTAEADALLERARGIDPENAVVRQHFEPDGQIAPFGSLTEASENPMRAMRAADARKAGGPVQLTPSAGTHSFHVRGGAQDVLRAVCTAFGLTAQFDPSVGGGQSLRFDLENASFPEATRAAEQMTGNFAVTLEPKVLLFARNTTENRTQLQPLVEETLYMPGVTAESLTEYAAMARNLFNLKSVTAVGSAGGLVVRGDEGTLDRVNATFADLVDSGSDVLLDLTLYEVDTSRTRSLGTATPSSLGVFPVASEAQSLISSNQSLISAAIASNQLVLTGNPYTDAIAELGLLLASGVVSASQFSNLLGVFGHYGGLPLAGIFLGSSTTFNATLNSSDIRILDATQLRVHSGQDGLFRAGTRYPIETGIYSSNVSSSLTAATAGLSINGTSVSSLLSQYLGSTSVSVPQIQFEDLGLTLKATPTVLRSNAVQVKLDFKVEALGSGTVNTLPILDNRALTSQITIPTGQTAVLASLVDKEEQRSIDGLPFLSELPGFQGTEKSSTITNTELLITLTPHVVRNRHMEVASRRLLMPLDSGTPQGGGNGERQAEETQEPQEPQVRRPEIPLSGRPQAPQEPAASEPAPQPEAPVQPLQPAPAATPQP